MQMAFGDSPEAVWLRAREASEQYLKAALAFRHLPPPSTHSLVELIRLCATELGDDTGLRIACEVLDASYERSRHQVRPLPTDEEVVASAAAAQTVRAAVEAFTANAQI